MSERRRLPDRRHQVSFEFEHAGLFFNLGIGFYEDGRYGEVFMSSDKPGSPIEAIARDAAVVLLKDAPVSHGALAKMQRQAIKGGEKQ